MYKSESIINNLLIEVDSLSYRMKNIKLSFYNTSHSRLRERLLNENQNLLLRLSEISSIAKLLNTRTNEKISFSNLLMEKCIRALLESKTEKNLFFI